MLLQNMSGIVRTPGSDYDLQLWVSERTWSIVSRLFRAVRRQVRLSLFGKVELFIVPKTLPDTRALAAAISIHIQQQWDDDTVEVYRARKLAISHLRGVERKIAKAGLAREFGLPTPQYKPHAETPR